MINRSELSKKCILYQVDCTFGDKAINDLSWYVPPHQQLDFTGLQKKIEIYQRLRESRYQFSNKRWLQRVTPSILTAVGITLLGYVVKTGKNPFLYTSSKLQTSILNTLHSIHETTPLLIESDKESTNPIDYVERYYAEKKDKREVIMYAKNESGGGLSWIGTFKDGDTKNKVPIVLIIDPSSDTNPCEVYGRQSGGAVISRAYRTSFFDSIVRQGQTILSQSTYDDALTTFLAKSSDDRCYASLCKTFLSAFQSGEHVPLTCICVKSRKYNHVMFTYPRENAIKIECLDMSPVVDTNPLFVISKQIGTDETQ